VNEARQRNMKQHQQCKMCLGISFHPTGNITKNYLIKGVALIKTIYSYRACYFLPDRLRSLSILGGYLFFTSFFALAMLTYKTAFLKFSLYLVKDF
jgi:hypothetical protein